MALGLGVGLSAYLLADSQLPRDIHTHNRRDGTTALGSQHYVTMVTDWLTAELTLILILLSLVACVLMYILYRKCKSNATGPHLYLEIGTKETVYRVKIAELRYAVSNYKLTVNQNVVKVVLVQKYLYALLRWSDVLTLQNKLLALLLDLPGRLRSHHGVATLYKPC